MHCSSGFRLGNVQYVVLVAPHNVVDPPDTSGEPCCKLFATECFAASVIKMVVILL